jgi:hypothetical protein
LADRPGQGGGSRDARRTPVLLTSQSIIADAVVDGDEIMPSS